jgi:hypothetical protein
MAEKSKDLTTTENKDFGNPVQVDTSKLFIGRLSRSDEEKKMREKTAHVGEVASKVTQDMKTTK